MAEGEIKVETTNTTDENVAEQQTGLTDMAPGTKATITNHEPALTDQGQEVLADMKQAPDAPMRPRYQMTPQAQATLKALRGH